MDANDKILLLAALVVALLGYLRSRSNPTLPYPPGPKKLPILGNLLDIPRNFEWITYAQWSKEYGASAKLLAQFSFL